MQPAPDIAATVTPGATLPPDIGAAAFPPPNPSAFWNTWFEQDGKVERSDLAIGHGYRFYLDLSPYHYAALRPDNASVGAPASSDIQKMIALDEADEVTFMVKPVLIEGGGLKVIGPLDALTMKVDLRRIREPDRKSINEYIAGDLTVSQFSTRVRAGSLSLDLEVAAQEPGCASIILAIFTQKGRVPLDYLVRRVAINEPGMPIVTCGAEEPSDQQLLHGGLGAMLQASAELASADAHPAAAAFHIFTTKRTSGSFVVFADGRAARDKTFYAWQTESNLIDYLTDPQKLTTMIDAARASASNGLAASYLPAARQLALKLFTGAGASANEAQAAEKAFKELVKDSPVRPVVVVRVSSEKLTGGQHKSFFLPLGILGASGTDADPPVLSQPITVVQPLPRERYSAGKSCVAPWTYGIPKKLDRFEDRSKVLDAEIEGIRKDSVKDLKAFFRTLDDPPKTPAHGFLVLAHHHDGSLWFDQKAESIETEDILRPFPPNSVGVFAACSVASAGGNNSVLLTKFNQRGVDAIVASPFPVPAEYATRMAMQFTKAVHQAQRPGAARTTVAELFGDAIKRTAEQLKTAINGKYEETGLEYVLLGNPMITMCHESSDPK